MQLVILNYILVSNIFIRSGYAIAPCSISLNTNLKAGVWSLDICRSISLTTNLKAGVWSLDICRSISLTTNLKAGVWSLDICRSISLTTNLKAGVWSLDICRSISLTTNFSWWYLCTYNSVVTSVTSLYNSDHYENIHHIIIILDL